SHLLQIFYLLQLQLYYLNNTIIYHLVNYKYIYIYIYIYFFSLRQKFIWRLFFYPFCLCRYLFVHADFY
ncbi:MAG: hypothetical protein N7Q72_04495, partial [Spiroplasma sp. Tabriz.8]|nr:hypothetical protein [Spiroplasma sp. Tabriz.8]